MNTTTKAEPSTVETTDELKKAIVDAQARILEIKALNHPTLIDGVTPADWLAWDGTNENATVCDHDELDDMNSDDSDMSIAA